MINKAFALTLGVSCFFALGLVSAQSINDAQIASIVVTANQVDIDAGKFAAARASSDAVKNFAQLMVTDHSGVNKAAVDLATKLKVTPQDNPTSQSLKLGGEKHLARLKTLSGSAFDKAYIDQEVAYHQQVLDAVDKVLIPNASNGELKALLVKVRPAFVAHLEHAKHLQKTVSSERMPERPPAKTHTVMMEGMRFMPEVITVAAGDTIVWVNQDLVAHTATSQTAGFDSKLVEIRKSWRYATDRSGEFAYVCSLHPTMTGTLRVR